MKKIIAIILTLVIMTPCISHATDYTCTQVYYPIIVNGTQIDTGDLPILNLNGSTYIPLRKIGEGSGLLVDWIADKKEVSIINSSMLTAEFNLIYGTALDMLNETELLFETSIDDVLHMCIDVGTYKNWKTQEHIDRLVNYRDKYIPQKISDLEFMANYWYKNFWGNSLGRPSEVILFNPNDCVELSKSAQQKINALIDVSIGYLNNTYTKEYHNQMFDIYSAEYYAIEDSILDITLNKYKLRNLLYRTTD